MRQHKKLLSVARAIAFTPAVLGATASHAASIDLEPVVVTAGRMEQNSFDVPVSIDVVSSSQLQNGSFNASYCELPNTSEDANCE